VPPDPYVVADAFQDEAITGWRIWNLSEDAAGPLLQPAGSGVDAPWKPMHRVEARCGRPGLLTAVIGPHVAPHIRCKCGIYASRSLEVFARPRPAWPPPTVVGTAALWGTVIEHERGWRARYAYPERLRIVCAMCAWFEPGPGTPVLVHTFADRLYGLCELHRGGIQVPDGRRTRATDLDPGVLQSRLLAAYAVDLVPDGPVRWLFEQPPTPAPPGYIPTIRVVAPEERPS
jgi:hypothetical protein